MTKVKLLNLQWEPRDELRVRSISNFHFNIILMALTKMSGGEMKMSTSSIAHMLPIEQEHGCFERRCWIKIGQALLRDR